MDFFEMLRAALNRAPVGLPEFIAADELLEISGLDVSAKKLGMELKKAGAGSFVKKVNRKATRVYRTDEILAAIRNRPAATTQADETTSGSGGGTLASDEEIARVRASPSGETMPESGATEAVTPVDTAEAKPKGRRTVAITAGGPRDAEPKAAEKKPPAKEAAHRKRSFDEAVRSLLDYGGDLLRDNFRTLSGDQQQALLDALRPLLFEA